MSLLNDFSLRVTGKNLVDLSQDEMRELKREAGWHVAAYGMSWAEFQEAMKPLLPSAAPEHPIEQGVDLRP